MGWARSLWSLLGRGLLRRTHVHSHPRLLGAGGVAILLYFLLSGWAGTATRFLIASDVGALVFLAGSLGHDGARHAGRHAAARRARR
jgi:hypothetical protein